MNIFLKSAMTDSGRFISTQGILGWLDERREAHQFEITQIPFSQLDKWGFEEGTGNLRHDSGRFFSIEGVRVKTNYGKIPQWEQPVINQPEIGFLGFITKKIDGVLYFLVQAKMEPGNINFVQLSPTLQATRSNFMRVHKGRTPPFLEQFVDHSKSRVSVDILQSEQGARFLRKRNRNIIIETSEEFEVGEDYVWLTLGQLLACMRMDNVVNMDARTVLSCIDFSVDAHDVASVENPICKALLVSLSEHSKPMHSQSAVISWFTEKKFQYELDVERVALKGLSGWVQTDYEIAHEHKHFFRVIACSVETDSREVAGWSQPLVVPSHEGLMAFVVKEFDGVLHFLVQAKVEPGNFDIVEMAPTVQCITGSYQNAPEGGRPPFLEYVLSAAESRGLYDTMQSEEGGRFFREMNRNMIIEAGSEFPETIPDNYIWLTAYQLKEFVKYNNFINVQARCLMASFFSSLWSMQ